MQETYTVVPKKPISTWGWVTYFYWQEYSQYIWVRMIDTKQEHLLPGLCDFQLLYTQSASSDDGFRLVCSKAKKARIWYQNIALCCCVSKIVFCINTYNLQIFIIILILTKVVKYTFMIILWVHYSHVIKWSKIKYFVPFLLGYKYVCFCVFYKAAITL